MPKQNTSQLERANRAATALGYSGVEGARQVIKKRSTQLGMNGTDQNRMTMSADTLNANPTEFAAQDAPPATESGALAGALEKQPDYTKQLAEQAKTAQTGEQKSFQELLNAQLGMEGQTSLTDTQYSQQGGVDDLTKKLNEYDQQLTMEQNSTRRRVEQIQKNSVGMSQQALNDEVDRVERESLAKQADISVIRAGVAQDYATAKSIADRAVTVAMEKQKMKLDVLGLNYTRNKDLFTKAEQRAFESAQTDRTNAYNETLASKKAISDYSLEAMKMGADGATISAIRSAKTPEKAQALAANFMGPLIDQERSLDRQAKLQQIEASRQSILSSQQSALIDRAKIGDPKALALLGITPDLTGKVKLDTEKAATIQKEMVGNDAYKAVRKGQDSLNALKTYEEAFNKYGLTGAYSPIANKELEAKYQAALLNLKEFFNLGVLNGPDLEILKGVIPPPTNQGLLYNPFQYSGAKSGINSMKQQIGDTLDDRYLSLKAQYGNYDDTNIGAVKDLDRIYFQNKAQLDPGVAQFLKDNPDMSPEEKLQVINSKF